MDVCLPSVLLLRVSVGDVHVVKGRVVVLVRVVGLQMTPVLTPVQVVGDVEVLVPVLHRVMLMMTLGSRHRAHPFLTDARRQIDRTPVDGARQSAPMDPLRARSAPRQDLSGPRRTKQHPDR